MTVPDDPGRRAPKIDADELTPIEVADAVWLAAATRFAWATGTSPSLISDPASLRDSGPVGSERPGWDVDVDVPPSMVGIGHPRPLPHWLESTLRTDAADDVTGAGLGEWRASIPPLLETAAIARALRPLHRKVPPRTEEGVVLDEEATANRAIEDDLWLPVTLPAKARWLDLTLVIDASPSTALWRSTVTAFESLLVQLGTFRTIRRRLLDVRGPVPAAKRAIPILRAGMPDTLPRGPAEITDPTGRRVVLVLTDGVSESWRDGTFATVLAMWGRRMPTALVHLLPQRLWRHGLPVQRAQLVPGGQLRPNGRWALHLPDAWLEPDPAASVPVGAVPIPVFELKARWLGRWAQLLLGSDNRPVDATVMVVDASSDPAATQTPTAKSSALERVKTFLGVASPAAFRLATLLAAVPVTFAVARLIQTELVPDAGTEHIVEVLTSGLFEPVTDATRRRDWDTVTFDVVTGVREELLRGARRSETVRVVHLVIDHFGERIGTFRHFRHMLGTLETVTAAELSGPAVPESGIERIVLRALSGPYLARARDLFKQIDEPTQPSIETTIASDDMPETEERVSSQPEHVPHKTPVGQDQPAHEPLHLPVPSQAGPEVDTLATDVASDPLSAQGPWAGLPRDVDYVPPIWGNVPARNLNFTGRVELLDSLNEHLAAAGTAAVLPAALHGMGGIGKTQIAVEYIYRHLADFDLVWWIQAAHATQIRSGFTELAQALRLPGADEANTAVPAVREALRRGRPWGRWLLVFDAAGGPETVRPFFPTSGPGKILITSRNPDWASVARPLGITTFMRGESIELLRRRGPEIEDLDANRLADTLGDLPLAIEQAAAWRAETGMPVSEYLRLFDEKVAEILDTSTPSDYELSVAAAWNVSFDELGKRNPAAHQLLQVCAFCSPEPISRQLFTGIRNITIRPELDVALRDPMRLSRAIRDITRYGLAKIDHRSNTLQLHRLVQLVLRNRMTPQHQAEMRHGTHMLLANLNPNDPVSLEQWQRYRELLPHAYASELIECDDRWALQLIVNLMSFLYRWGDHDEAVNLGERAVRQWTERFGEQDPQTLEAATSLGAYYWYVGRYAEAANLNRRTLAIRRQVDGENNEETLLAQLAVALDLRAHGDFAAAFGVTNEVRQKATAMFGEEDPTTLRAARIHAIDLRLNGRFRDAARLEEDTYHLMLEVLGHDHPETLSVLSALIIDRREAGDYIWASAENEKLAQRARQIHGDNNADTLRRFVYLAATRRKAGDHAAALALSGEIMEKFQARYSLSNFNAMACALGHSIDQRHAGDLRSARVLGTEVVELYRKNMGERHPYTFCASIDLAVTLRQLGDPDDIATARDLDARALEQLRTKLGPDHPHAIMCAVNLASDHAALGQTEQAVAVETDALVRAERVLGSDHPTTLAASLNLVLDLRAQDRAQEAESRYTDVLTRYRRTLGEQHPATVAASKGLRADCDIDPLPL